ncbi:hypothetical protein CIK05_00255 [Bdellovibrio sp. qaytius]|nr:hypothetical protein CIK05_00255 [Bdellovibrio sp. qaytius]
MYSKLFKVLVLSSAVFAFTACSQSTNSQTVHAVSDSASIVNGRPVIATDLYAKHTVAVAPVGEDPCTGVIIAPHFILSAGHCADYFENGEIFFGLKADKSATVYKIKNVTLHPKYCPRCTGRLDLADANDLSIVEFAEELPKGFEPVEFATLEQVKVGTHVHLAGYGIDENSHYDGAMKVTEVLIDQVGSSEIMTNELKSGSCNGDSGGPAYILENNKLLLAGITSRGDGPCRQLGIYTIPAAHQTWINTVLNIK